MTPNQPVVERRAFAVSLFQTGVPGFYARLGARALPDGFNTFINSRPERPGESVQDRHGVPGPWWEPDIMIYPSAFGWPEGTLDLCGPGW